MDPALSFVFAFAALSGWAGLFLQAWRQRQQRKRGDISFFLRRWRVQTQQTLVLYAIEQELSSALSGERGTPHRTLKQQFRERVAEKLGVNAEFDQLRPSRLKATLTDIGDLEAQLETGLRTLLRNRTPGGRRAEPE